MGAYLCDALSITADGKDAFVDTRDDLADACLDACFLAEIGDVFATFSNNYTGILCTDESPESEDLLGRGGGGTRLVANRTC